MEIKSIVEFCVGGNPDGFRVTNTTTGQVFQGDDLVPQGRYAYAWKMNAWKNNNDPDAPEWAEGDFEITITPSGEIIDHSLDLLAKIFQAMANQTMRETTSEQTSGLVNFKQWALKPKKG